MTIQSILPTGKTPAATNLNDFSWLFYGEPGIGKSTLANSFPGALFLDVDQGLKGIEAAKIDLTSWGDFLQSVKAIRDESHDFRTVVVDTVDLLFMLCEKSVCEDLGIEHVSEAQWGKGWDVMKARWTDGIHQLRTAKSRKTGKPICILFVSHERKESVKIKRGKKMVETGRFYISSALPNRGRIILHSAVDFIVRCELLDNERTLRTQPAETDKYDIEAKGRGRKDAQLPDLLPMDFRELFAAFKNTLGKTEK